jgi:protein-tyrosine kinase
MSIIEKAAQRLEEMSRAGVTVPWSAAGLTEAEARALSGPHAAATGGTTVSPQPSRETAVRVRTSASSAAIGALPAGIASMPPASQSRKVTIDLTALLDAGYLVPGQPRSGLADEFRGIKRPLLKNMLGESTLPIHRSNLILVTSAVPGEGKTFCAVNLAMSIASEVDSSVLLVDCDVIQPSMLTRLGVPGEHPGILDLLTRDDLRVSDVMLRTNVPKLSLLPSGRPRLNATELLASAAMERLLDDFSQRYADRVIIFDAPPLLVTTEAKVLASRMGQILVVVDESRSEPKQVAQAFTALDGVPIVMSVLNRSVRRTVASRYSYYEA